MKHWSRPSRSARSVVCVLAASVGALLALSRPALAGSPIVPPAMVDACKGHAEASACAFTMAGKTIQGVCSPLPEGTLACRPGGAPRPKRAK
jgi:hypothetical protein